MNLAETYRNSSPLAKIIIAIIVVFIVVALLCGCFFLVQLLLGDPEPAATPPPLGRHLRYAALMRVPKDSAALALAAPVLPGCGFDQGYVR